MTTATSSASELLAAGAVVFLLVEIGEAASVAADGLLEGEREPLPFVRGAFVAIEHLERADAGVVDEVVCAQEVGVLAGDEGLVPDELADWLSWQSLRHSFASMLATNLELPATTLAQLVGQADTGFTLRVYARDGRDAATVVKDVLSRARRAKVGR